MRIAAKSMFSDSDPETLVARAIGGDREAFEGIARRYLRVAYAVALAHLRRPEDAEDVAQDVMVTAFERLHTLRAPARLGAWVSEIARNQARNWMKRRRLREQPGEPRPVEVPDRDSSETSGYRTALIHALERLTPIQREVVLLHDLEGWTHPEIADAIDLSVTASRWHLFYARRVMRAYLDDQNLEGGGR
jgi:RNA polymerase sigma-70 factor (ECF subfamily)